MEHYGHAQLREARDNAGMTRLKAAFEIGVSEDTLKRWEMGIQQPTPDDVDCMERLYHAPGLWHAWMRSTYSSYRSRYPESLDATTALSIVNVRHQLADVLALQDAAERDALPNDQLDDPRLRSSYIRECQEAIAALAAMLARIEATTKE